MLNPFPAVRTASSAAGQAVLDAPLISVMPQNNHPNAQRSGRARSLWTRCNVTA